MDIPEGTCGIRQRHALLASSSALLVAYTNYSLLGMSQCTVHKTAELASAAHVVALHAGLAFLLIFYAWGLAYLRRLSPTAAVNLKQSLWGLLSAGATALLAGQIVLQLIYAAGNASWATDAHTRRVLQLLGLQKAGSVSQIALVGWELVLAMLAFSCA